MDITDFVLHAKELIPRDVCAEVLEQAHASESWYTGQWYNNQDDSWSKKSYSQHAIQPIDAGKEFYKAVDEWKSIYLEAHPSLNFSPPTKFTTPKINKYPVGSGMDAHVDHIHSIFDGKHKGIPIMTTLGILDDQFEGGEFVMYDNLVIDLKPGDLLAFPSLFIYQHEVKKVTKGTRYSWISWWF